MIEDDELTVIKTCVTALSVLTREQQERVIRYLKSRFGEKEEKDDQN